MFNQSKFDLNPPLSKSSSLSSKYEEPEMEETEINSNNKFQINKFPQTQSINGVKVVSSEDNEDEDEDEVSDGEVSLSDLESLVELQDPKEIKKELNTHNLTSIYLRQVMNTINKDKGNNKNLNIPNYEIIEPFINNSLCSYLNIEIINNSLSQNNSTKSFIHVDGDEGEGDNSVADITQSGFLSFDSLKNVVYSITSYNFLPITEDNKDEEHEDEDHRQVHPDITELTNNDKEIEISTQKETSVVAIPVNEEIKEVEITIEDQDHHLNESINNNHNKVSNLIKLFEHERRPNETHSKSSVFSKFKLKRKSKKLELPTTSSSSLSSSFIDSSDSLSFIKNTKNTKNNTKKIKKFQDGSYIFKEDDLKNLNFNENDFKIVELFEKAIYYEKLNNKKNFLLILNKINYNLLIILKKENNNNNNNNNNNINLSDSDIVRLSDCNCDYLERDDINKDQISCFSKDSTNTIKKNKKKLKFFQTC
ncbi:hypothetical protein B5S31_g4409 [[Candida] boidinii]|nr:hypothetical protein B5S31_g4409 [[Candida] boidinii]